MVKLLLAQKADLIKNKQDMHVKMWHASCRAPAVNMASHGLESDEMQDAPEHLISSQGGSALCKYHGFPMLLIGGIRGASTACRGSSQHVRLHVKDKNLRVDRRGTRDS